MKPSVYIETPIVSYLTARPGNDIRVMANRNTTVEWWEDRRGSSPRTGLFADMGNCKHIANAAMRPKVEAVCRHHGYEPPVICTPQELMEE